MNQPNGATAYASLLNGPTPQQQQQRGLLSVGNQQTASARPVQQPIPPLQGSGGPFGSGSVLGSPVRAQSQSQPLASSPMRNQNQIQNPTVGPMSALQNMQNMQEYRPSNQILAMIQKGSQQQQQIVGPSMGGFNVQQQQQQQQLQLHQLQGHYGQFSTGRMDNVGSLHQIGAEMRSTTPPSLSTVPSSNMANSSSVFGADQSMHAAFQGLPLGQEHVYPTAAKRPSSERFGLLGLLNVIKLADQDLNMLAIGFDLTTLGLNLNSSEYLYPTFGAPWNDGPTKIVPEFKLPICYQLSNAVPLKNSHFQKFQDETLFYIFYSMPRDVLQLVSAKELTVRKWKYHKDLKLWFKKQIVASEPLMPEQNRGIECGPFTYFDVNTWTKRVTPAEFTIEPSKVWQE